MGKGARNRENNKQTKFREDQIESMKRILESSKFSKSENKAKKRIIKNKKNIIKLCDKVYNIDLQSQSKWFKKKIYDEYSVGYVTNNYSDFHLMCLTKCNIMDTDWRNYITIEGKAK